MPLSPPESPSIETRAALKRRIATLELDNALEHVNKLIKTPVHSYVREGRAISRLVTLTHPVADLIAEYDRRRMQMEASNGEVESIQPSDAEERTYRSYKKLVAWCPSIKWLMRPTTPESEVVSACRDLKKGADAARGDDAKTLKTSVADWLNEREPRYEVPFEKQGRGFHHEVTGRLLCPVDYDWSDAAAIRDHHPSHIVTANMWPTFMYPNGAYNKYRPSDGLFKGELLIRAFRCIFTSPSSARVKLELHDTHNHNQPTPSKSRRTMDDIHTRCNVAGLLKMRSVQPRAIIAYIAVQCRFALSSCTSWGLMDDSFDYEIFYNNIVDWFERPRSQAKAQEIEDLLLWWNRTIVFDRLHSSTLQPQDAEDLSVAMSMNY